MSLDQLFEQIKNIFQGRGQPHGAQPPVTVQSAQKETQPVPDMDTVAAIAAALHLSGKTESAANKDSEIAAAIAASLHLHLTTSADAAYGSDKKSDAQSPWSHYGREQIQNVRFQIFNRPVSSEKSILIRQR
ncbi:MAG: hypothetical protein KKE00_03975 [Proteobacteria bacterium]|nr:hypothetical protein [Pseudomonadota bacterium]MBU1398224.1 hypothetical protein [Pseudomonadota bacterium]MBU1569669.1 hypothetical protein [Pseudomonadota bacterium]